MVYDDAKQMVEYVGQALKQTSREAAILLYAKALNPHIQTMTDMADRVFCFYEGQPRGRIKENMRIPEAQATLEAFT